MHHGMAKEIITDGGPEFHIEPVKDYTIIQNQLSCNYIAEL